jgi:DNA replication and repair protein RecF
LIINSVDIENFKNIENAHLDFHSGYNLIIGENAQGKTNLLEALWLFTGCHSFRNTRERDYVSFEKDRTEINFNFQDNRRKQNIHYILMRNRKNGSKDKKITLNKVNIQMNKQLFESFQCVVFTPDDIDLVKGNPERRRSFIDLCISQVNPYTINVLKKFDNLIMQRSAVLKNIFYNIAKPDDLDIWDKQLCKVGCWISFYRHQYTQKLSDICQKLYGMITDRKENLKISYSSNVYGADYDYPEKEPDSEMVAIYYEKLKESRQDDIRTQRTRCGAGRDELVLTIDGFKVKDFGSQGQKKSTALVMKLAQAMIYKEKTGESPVILLDDVMGELDSNRQKFVCRIIDDMQTFITTCHKESISPDIQGKIFEVENGKFKELT